MFAIVETSGKQFRVEEGTKLIVDYIAGSEPGAEITLDRVLLVGGSTVKVGEPTVAGASVQAKVVDHFKGDKVIAFKYRPRKRYRRRVGFRHTHTTLEILSINA